MDLTFDLPDGRTMSVADIGDAGGAPVLYVAGFGHCRLARHPDDSLTTRCGVRLLAIDPPGLGASDPWPGYSLEDWTDDVEQLMRRLRIERAGFLGWSWGGPYAMAAASFLPERISSLGLVSALGGWLSGPGSVHDVPYALRSFAASCHWFPPPAKEFLRRERHAVALDPMASVVREVHHAGAADRAAMADPAIRGMMIASAFGCWQQGIEGMFDLGRAVALPWGFGPATVHAPTHVWHGDQDREILPSMAHRLASGITGATLTMFEHEGHLALFTRWEEILRGMIDLETGLSRPGPRSEPTTVPFRLAAGL